MIGSVAPMAVKEYLFSTARPGQRLAVRLDSPEAPVKFAILQLIADTERKPVVVDCSSPTGSEPKCSHWEGMLPDSGDYVVAIYGGARRANYKLTIGIE